MLGILLKPPVYGPEGTPEKNNRFFETSERSLVARSCDSRNSTTVTGDLALTAYFCMRQFSGQV